MRFNFTMEAEHAANMDRHEAWAQANDIPLVPISAPHSRKLAIVGGGPSVRSKLAKLRKWKGDIWAINATVYYLARKGISATLVTVDPITLTDEDFEAHTGGKDALLAACCDPRLFEEYAGRVQAFYTRPSPYAPFVADGANTTATRLPMLAIKMGYRDMTFFGCEGSYEDESHITENKRSAKRLYIQAGSMRYCTEPHFMLQSEWLAGLLTKYPDRVRDESGGLLRAMCRHPDWTVIGVSDAMKTHLEASHEKHRAHLMEKPWHPQIRAALQSL